MPFTRWTSSDNFTKVEAIWDLNYLYPMPIGNVVSDESWVHDVLTRSLQVLVSATSAPDEHVDLMDGMVPATHDHELRERREAQRQLGRIGIPQQFKASNNSDVADVYIVENNEDDDPTDADDEISESSESGDDV